MGYIPPRRPQLEEPLCEALAPDDDGYSSATKISAAVENGRLAEAAVRSLGCLGECGLCGANVHVDPEIPFTPPDACVMTPAVPANA